MQSDPKQLYKLTSERTGVDIQIYKDIGTFIFSELYNNMRKPKSLIIKLKGVGTWYLRKKRMETIMSKFPPNFEKTQEDFPSDTEFLRNENKKELFKIFQDRLVDYDNYITLRKQVQAKRHETQVPIKSQEESQ